MDTVTAAALAATLLMDSRIAELEERLDAMSREIETMKVPQSAADAPLAPQLGFGPAAAKVYGVKRGVSVGGYGEVTAETFMERRQDGLPSGKSNTWDALRAILYLGYKFNDRIVFNSETEFEHGHSLVRGEVSVEFMHLDFRLHDVCGLRAGMLLVPVGLLNELHEPTLFPSVRRPSVENAIIPTTWRENGAGVFGEWGPLSWRGYALAGLQAVKDAAVKGFSASGIRDGRQKGSKSFAEDVAGVFRLDAKGPFGVSGGASVYGGRSGQNVLDTATKKEIKARTTLVEGHATFQHRGLDVRGLYARGTIGSVPEVNKANALTGKASVGEVQWGWYAQASYDVFSLLKWDQTLAPFIRYERFDPQARVPSGFTKDAGQFKKEATVGVMYKPHSQVAVKADVLIQKTGASTGVNQVNAAIGYLF